jgi:hypothetical protein
MKQLLKEREPALDKLMDLTLKKEREAQEHKDAKVLEILKIKDRQIDELQERIATLEGEYAEIAGSF